MGFDFLTFLTEETKDPKKTIPKAVSYTIGIITVLYVVTAISLYGVYPLHEVDNPDTAVSTVFEMVGLKWVSVIITVAAFLGI